MLKFITNWESILMEKLSSHIGYVNAVRVEDITIVIVSVFLGYVLGQIRITYLFRSNYSSNSKLNKFTFIRVECDGVVSYEFKKPKTILDRIELILALRMAKQNLSMLFIDKNKWYARLSLFIYLSLLVVLFLIFTLVLNVVSE